MELIDALDWVTERGWPAFPNYAGSKAPATKHGFKDASTDERQLAAWWKAQNSTWSVCTGTPDRNGWHLTVVDIDVAGAEADLPGELPLTFEVNTGKGRHLYYISKTPIRGHVPVAGIDVKGEGGYVLLPGSLHPSGAIYEAVNADLNFHNFIATAPEWLHQTATERREYEAGDPVPAGERRNFLVSEAGRLRNTIKDEVVLAAALHALNQGRCQPPFTADEYDIDRLAHDFMQKDGYTGPATILWGDEQGEQNDQEPEHETEPEHDGTFTLYSDGGYTWIEDPKVTNKLLGEEFHRIKAREIAVRAARMVDGEQWSRPEYPPALDELLKEEIDPPEYLIEDLHIVGTNTLLSARYKSGKTTLIDNLARAYADGADFLGKQVHAHAGRMGILDFEMTRRQHVDWLRRQGIQRPERLALWSVRDAEAGFPLWTPQAQRHLAGWVEELGIELLVIDTLTAAVGGWPVASGEPMNSNAVATEFWKIINRLKEASGLKDAIVVSQFARAHEQGNERTIGAIQWDAGCDTRWIMTVKGNNATGNREFFAHGRDAEMEPVQLAWDRDTNHLEVSGTVDEVKERVKLADAASRVIQALQGGPLKTAELRVATKLNGNSFPAIVDQLTREGVISTEQGPRGSTVYELIDTDIAMVLP